MHFSENTCRTPDVDVDIVPRGLFTEQDFGRAVPQRDNLVCICPERESEGTRQTKVSEFNGTYFIQ
jgi:hypothetical protein